MRSLSFFSILYVVLIFSLPIAAQDSPRVDELELEIVEINDVSDLQKIESTEDQERLHNTVAKQRRTRGDLLYVAFRFALVGGFATYSTLLELDQVSLESAASLGAYAATFSAGLMFINPELNLWLSSKGMFTANEEAEVSSFLEEQIKEYILATTYIYSTHIVSGLLGIAENPWTIEALVRPFWLGAVALITQGIWETSIAKWTKRKIQSLELQSAQDLISMGELGSKTNKLWHFNKTAIILNSALFTSLNLAALLGSSEALYAMLGAGAVGFATRIPVCQKIGRCVLKSARKAGQQIQQNCRTIFRAAIGRY